MNAARLVLTMLTAIAATAPVTQAAQTQIELTFTPNYFLYNGTLYPEQSNDNFTGPDGPFPSPQFSKITATITFDLSQPDVSDNFTSELRVHSVDDPSVVTHQFVQGITSDRFHAFQPAHAGQPYHKITIGSTGPDTVRGSGYFESEIFFPPASTATVRRSCLTRDRSSILTVTSRSPTSSTS